MPTSSSALPAKIGRYDIRAKLADGGTATVYVGRLSGPAGFEELQAVKVIKPELSADRDFTNMFLDEARIAAKLSHPSIAQVHELGETTAGVNKRLYIAMELLFGESLWDVWSTARAKKQKLPDDVVAWIGARIAEGLHHAHELTSGGVKQNVVHRDVNPSNLFITYDGQVKIIDFGLAKAKNRVTVTGLGVIQGKVAYMAPEQTKSGRAASPSEARDRSQTRTGDLDHRADLFALGITLYELTADTRLFKRKDNVETLAAVAECAIPDPTASQPDYSPALWEILKKALSKDREDRYQSGKEMAEALDTFSRSRGRVVTASTVAAFMEELFGAQRERYQKWLDEVRSERPVPSAEESFRGPTSADENALIVGAEAAPAARPVTDRKNDRPRLPGDRTSDVRGFDREPAKRPDPFAP
ncbi:MAG TPA: serine/threonine-protein kinase, partial [Polyangiaceae bacterium]|nr:serine/threonine-protein kinase [Polyangiaceae bacterium]